MVETLTTAAPARPAWADYAYGSRIDHFRWWCAEHCRHAAGPFTGRPLDLECWQEEFFGEVLAVDEAEVTYWLTGVLVVPRKNGKTTSTGAIAGYDADQEEDLPIVGLAATSDEQASELFDAVAAFIAASPYLSGRFHIRDYDGEIARTDAGAYIRRMKMDWRRLHGKNLSRLLADEIHAWSTPNLRRSWEALTTGDAARPGFQALCITTEGEPDETGQSILGQLVADNESYGEVERRPGLTISRNHEARVLIYRYSAPMPDADPQPVRTAYRAWTQARAAGAADAPELERAYREAAAVCTRAVKLANPASWVTEPYLLRKAIDPKLKRSAFLRYHACVAVSSEDTFVAAERWDELAGGDAIEPARVVCLGWDGSRTHDTTVLAWASRAEDGRIDVDARIFSVRADAPHHELHQGGKIDYDAVEQEAIEAFGTWDVREAAYDPRYLERSADILTTRLPEACIAPVQPGSALMKDALAAFERGVLDAKIRHRGDPAIRAHVAASRAVRDGMNGAIRRLTHHPEHPIDAVIAMALAYWRATLLQDAEPWAAAW
jgi:phage terminase large subunit-like protein